MVRFTFIIILFAMFCVTAAGSEKPESFDDAKSLSIETGKPVLLEFVHDD